MWSKASQGYGGLGGRDRGVELRCSVLEEVGEGSKVKNCKVYWKDDRCVKCERGFWLDPEERCLPCRVKNCDLCGGGGGGGRGRCWACRLGFYFRNGECKKIQYKEVFNPEDVSCRVAQMHLDLNIKKKHAGLLESDTYKVQKDGNRKVNRLVFNLVADFTEKGQKLAQSRALEIQTEIVADGISHKGPTVYSQGDHRVVSWVTSVPKDSNFFIRLYYTTSIKFLTFEDVWQMPTIKMGFNSGRPCMTPSELVIYTAQLKAKASNEKKNLEQAKKKSELEIKRKKAESLKLAESQKLQKITAAKEKLQTQEKKRASDLKTKTA